MYKEDIGHLLMRFDVLNDKKLSPIINLYV